MNFHGNEGCCQALSRWFARLVFSLAALAQIMTRPVRLSDIYRKLSLRNVGVAQRKQTTILTRSVIGRRLNSARGFT